MTMHTVFFKEHEGIVPDPINGSLSKVPLWSGLGSPSPAMATAYGNISEQSKLPSLELSAGVNHQFTAKEPDQDQHGLAKGNPFAIFSAGDCRTAENGAKTNYMQNVSSVQAASVDYQGQFKLEFGQPLICAQYPYAEQCYGVYSAYGTQTAGRMMLPLSMASDGAPIFVNAKQYNGIMRRRKSRAKAAEMQNQAVKMRKPFLHLSRHLHAVRRPRGIGGRFLNTKNSNTSTEKTSQKETDKQENQHPHSTESQISEALQSDGGKHSNESNSSTSASPGPEVTSYLHHFQINNLQTSFQPFLDMGNTGLGIAMAAAGAGNTYLKV